MPKRIAMVGAGYLGARLAKHLESEADVTLIEQHSHFVHAPAMIRAVVEHSILGRALIPYDQLLKRGKLIQSRATQIDGEGVTLDDGQRIKADYFVVSTGSHNAMPFKPTSAGTEELRAYSLKIHE